MPAPVRRRAAREEEASTRERMLDVALRAFAELGYQGASTRAIAARAGVNQGLIPYYVGSKERLWREAVDRAFAELRDELDPAVAAAGRGAPGTPGGVERVLRRVVRFVARHPDFVRLMSEEGKREGPRMRWIVDRHVRPLYQATQELLRRAADEGLVPPDTDPAFAYYILIGAATQIYHQGPECRRLTGMDLADDAVIEAHADALVAMLVHPASRRERR